LFELKRYRIFIFKRTQICTASLFPELLQESEPAEAWRSVIRYCEKDVKFDERKDPLPYQREGGKIRARISLRTSDAGIIGSIRSTRTTRSLEPHLTFGGSAGRGSILHFMSVPSFAMLTVGRVSTLYTSSKESSMTTESISIMTGFRE